jgi:hypothetical protein
VWRALPDDEALAVDTVVRDEHHVSILAWVAGTGEGSAIAEAVDGLDPTRRVVPRSAEARANALWFT